MNDKPNTSANTDQAWTSEKLTNPHQVPDKARRVQQMFAAIAKSYDLNNRLHSMWQDQAWRRKAVKMCNVNPTDIVLDVACGTGDLSMAFKDAGAKHVMGMDFTHQMLQVAAFKKRSENEIFYADGDAMALPVVDQAVNIASIAFGIRNVASPMLAVEEFYRVLKPGGRLCILEFSLPRNPIMRGLYQFYFKQIMPRTATLISRDRSGAYKYLPQSVNTFLGREQLVGMMQQAGFKDIKLKPLTFGIAVCYVGIKPE